MPDQLTHLLDQIDQLDQQATKGPWETRALPVTVLGHTATLHAEDADGETWTTEFPPEIGSLIHPADAQLAAWSRTALPAMAKAVRAVLELHRSETWYYLEDSPEWTYPTKQEISEAFDVGIDYTAEEIRSFQVCIHCAEVEQGAAEDLGHLTAIYPCGTVRAITEALGGTV